MPAFAVTVSVPVSPLFNVGYDLPPMSVVVGLVTVTVKSVGTQPGGAQAAFVTAAATIHSGIRAVEKPVTGSAADPPAAIGNQPSPPVPACGAVLK